MWRAVAPKCTWDIAVTPPPCLCRVDITDDSWFLRGLVPWSVSWWLCLDTAKEAIHTLLSNLVTWPNVCYSFLCLNSPRTYLSSWEDSLSPNQSHNTVQVSRQSLLIQDKFGYLLCSIGWFHIKAIQVNSFFFATCPGLVIYKPDGDTN